MTTPKKTFAAHLRKRPLPSIEELAALFRYDPDTGHIFNRKERPHHRGRADYHRGQGYLSVNAPGNLAILSHRLAFALMEGRWPHIVDHINRDRSDNRWANLREVTHAANMANRANYGRSSYKAGHDPLGSPEDRESYWPGTPSHTPTPPRADLPATPHGVKKQRVPDIGDLRRHFAYDPETGFIWQRRYYVTAPHKRRGDFIEPVTGYAKISRPNWFGQMQAHRVAFALMEGRWPHVIDHINGDRSDNRWANLREATLSENALNSPIAGLKGRHIYRDRTKNKWFVQIGNRATRQRKTFRHFCAAVRYRTAALAEYTGPTAPRPTGYKAKSRTG
jgi:hypothetical protein